MGFVKLSTGLLDSSLWEDRVARDVFLTALLMALPFELTESIQALNVRALDPSDFLVPPGWYGIVESSGVGIVRRSLSDPEEGLAALERLGAPDPASRSSAFGGRRLVRVSGGFLVLNFIAYRDRDYTSASRSKRYRTRQKDLASSRGLPASLRSAASSRRVATPSHRIVTQAEAEEVAEGREGGEAGEAPKGAGAKTTERPQRRARARQDAQFEAAWLLYPKRAGGNSKTDAMRAWDAQIARGVSPEALHAGVMRYAAFCRATAKLGTEYVMQTARFFGPSLQWQELWVAPPMKLTRSKQETGIQNLTDAMKRRAEDVTVDGH